MYINICGKDINTGKININFRMKFTSGDQGRGMK